MIFCPSPIPTLPRRSIGRLFFLFSVLSSRLDFLHSFFNLWLDRHSLTVFILCPMTAPLTHQLPPEREFYIPSPYMLPRSVILRSLPFSPPQRFYASFTTAPYPSLPEKPTLPVRFCRSAAACWLSVLLSVLLFYRFFLMPRVTLWSLHEYVLRWGVAPVFFFFFRPP